MCAVFDMRLPVSFLSPLIRIHIFCVCVYAFFLLFACASKGIMFLMHKLNLLFIIIVFMALNKV